MTVSSSHELKGLCMDHQKILDALAAHPEGLTMVQIEEMVLGPDNRKSQIGRRLRDLRKYFIIDCRHQKGSACYLYYLKGRKQGGVKDGQISERTRAKVLHHSGRRCQLCGRTVSSDGIKLQVDHKIPQEWGGKNDEENLWALCEECNRGKKNYFSSFNPELMGKVLCFDSPHQRLAEMLRLHAGGWVDSYILEFVANFDDYQEDWQKRLRELRYLGFKIDVRLLRICKRKASQYRLANWVDGIDDLTKAARQYEAVRAKKNKAAKL